MLAVSTLSRVGFFSAAGVCAHNRESDAYQAFSQIVLFYSNYVLFILLVILIYVTYKQPMYSEKRVTSTVNLSDFNCF